MNEKLKMNRALLCMLLLLWFGCKPKGTIVEGVYSRFSSSEFSKAYDTLIVGGVDPETRTCMIQRNTGYIRIANGIEQPKQWRSERMLTIYDETNHQLNDLKTGRSFLFRNKELVFGTAIYKQER